MEVGSEGTSAGQSTAREVSEAVHSTGGKYKGIIGGVLAPGPGSSEDHIAPIAGAGERAVAAALGGPDSPGEGPLPLARVHCANPECTTQVVVQVLALPAQQRPIQLRCLDSAAGGNDRAHLKALVPGCTVQYSPNDTVSCLFNSPNRHPIVGVLEEGS